MRFHHLCVALAVAVVGCGEKDTPYVAAIRDELPVYCYQTLAGVDCYAKPNFRDERQLVNFYGPPPRDFERPRPPAPARLDPPPEVDWYCRVAEPDACPLPPASSSQTAAAMNDDDPPPLEPVLDETLASEPSFATLGDTDPSPFDAVP